MGTMDYSNEDPAIKQLTVKGKDSPREPLVRSKGQNAIKGQSVPFGKR